MNKLLNLFFLLLLFSCKPETKDTGEKGTVYYFSEFDKMDRMKLYDGGKTLFTCLLEKNIPDSQKNVLSGKTFYLIFDNPDLLKEGAVYKFPNKDIDLLIAEWKGKDSFNLNPNVSGTVKVSSHKQYIATVLDIDIKIRTGLDDFKSYRFKKEFSCIKHHKKFKGEMPAPDSAAFGFEAENFSAELLNGKWQRKGEFFLDKESGRWMEYFYLKEKISWEIKEGRLVNPKSEDFKVENARILMKDSSGSKLFIVNSFRNDSLMITNPLSPERSRYVFVREK